MRRVCIINLAHAVIDFILSRLPNGVSIRCSAPDAHRAFSVVTLQGDGLPEWCAEPKDCSHYAHANIWVSCDGAVKFEQIDPPSMYSKVPMPSLN